MPEDPRELSVTRHIAASPERVWQIMTERLTEWWCPRPWSTEIIAIDWRSGGRFATVMHGPDGEREAGDGKLLEVVPGKRLVFTDAFEGDWIPHDPFLVGMMEIAPENGGTRYTARARHWTDDALERHKAMGFEQGWGAVADQLAELAEAE